MFKKAMYVVGWSCMVAVLSMATAVLAMSVNGSWEALFWVLIGSAASTAAYINIVDPVLVAKKR